MKLTPLGKKLDKMASEIVRMSAIIRSGGCERCGSWKESWKRLHWAHMFGRNRKSVRWDLLNTAGLCPGCHRYIDSQATDKVEFFKKLIGGKEFDLLEMRANTPQKVDEDLVYLYLKAELDRVRREYESR